MSNEELKQECIKYNLLVSEKQFTNVQTLANYLKTIEDQQQKFTEPLESDYSNQYKLFPKRPMFGHEEIKFNRITLDSDLKTAVSKIFKNQQNEDYAAVPLSTTYETGCITSIVHSPFTMNQLQN